MTVWSPVSGGWLYGIGKYHLIFLLFSYQQKIDDWLCLGCGKKRDKIFVFLKKYELLTLFRKKFEKM